MKILVCAKRVVDANVKVRVKPDNSDVDIQFSKMSLNPFDENALEEAVKIKNNGIADEIVAISIGNDKCSDTLRSALARGADRAILIKTEIMLDPLMVAKTLKHIVLKESPDLIMLGKQAIDDDANQVGQMLAGMLNYPQGTFASKIEFIENNTKCIVNREIDNGIETLEITLPAVITADLQLNDPKFITLPQLMQAKKKPLDTINLEDLCVVPAPSLRIVSAVDGEMKKECKMLNSIDEVITILKNEKVI